MSYADKLFKETCRDILVNGTDTKGSEARLHAGPFWEDTGKCAYTIKKFGVGVDKGFSKRNPTIFMTCDLISGINGRTKQGVLEKLTVTSSRKNIATGISPLMG